MITSPQFSFIQLSSEIPCCCEVPLIVSNINDLMFYINADETFRIGFASMAGDQLALTEIAANLGWYNLEFDPSLYFACGDCFRILIKTATETYLSNVLMYDNDPIKSMLVQYKSTDETYFPFGANEARVRLPMILSNPNPITEKEDYTDANGVINNPFKTRRQKYELIIDYLPLDFHKKLQVALMHKLTINGMSVIESGDYKIDWDNMDSSSGNELVMAKTEISEQDIVILKNC